MIGVAMCDALQYMHTRKPSIIHRDVKPGNVRITPDGRIYLVDFGLAKLVKGGQATTTGARAMTPGYSPPEQYGTGRTDLRTDIYSLGATLYAGLTSIIPEDGLARAMDNTQLTPLRKRNSKVSRRLAAAIEKAMDIDPADRFQTAEEFKRSLLGSKSKTQRLPGEYLIQPPPPIPLEEQVPSAIEREVEPVNSFGKKNEVQSEAPREAPEFKPRKKRKKFRLVRMLLWLILLLAVGVTGIVRFVPTLVPPNLLRIMPPFLLAPTGAPVIVQPFAQPTATPTHAPTETATPAPPTSTPTVAPTKTLPPVIENTLTPTVGPTPMGADATGEILARRCRRPLPQAHRPDDAATAARRPIGRSIRSRDG